MTYGCEPLNNTRLERSIANLRIEVYGLLELVDVAYGNMTYSYCDECFKQRIEGEKEDLLDWMNNLIARIIDEERSRQL